MRLNVRFGANEMKNVQIDGTDCGVGEVRDVVSELLSIPDDAVAQVNGVNVEDDYTLHNGESVLFIKTTGDKG